MSLQNKIQQDVVAAMKAKDADKLSVLRMVKTAITNLSIEKKKDNLDDAEVIGLLQKQVKQRRESVENYEKGGRRDLADKEKKEIEILSEYLPEAMSDQELETIVKKAIAESGAQGKADMGKIMKIVMPQVQGRADGKQVNAVAARLLGG